MIIDDKHANLIAKALFWYCDQLEDELEEVNQDTETKEYMGGLMTRDEYIRDSETTIKTINEQLLPFFDTVSGWRDPFSNTSPKIPTLSTEQKEILKSKIDSL